MFGRTGRKVGGLAGLKTLATVGVLLAAILISYFIWRSMVRAEDGKATSAPPPPPEVAVVVVQPERVTITTELPGRTSANQVAEVRPQVSGIIQKRLFEEGADVKEGELLYQIDPALFQAAVNNAAANLVAARKTADQARAAVAARLANVRQRQSTWDLAKTDRQRFEALAKEGAVSISERDKAVTGDEVAEAALRTAEAQVRSDEEAVAVAEATIQQAEAALESARINLGYTKITAPISGRIGKSNVTVGALVTAQQPVALATIQKLDPIFVDTPQSTADLLRLRHSIETGQIKGAEADQAAVKLLLEDGSPYPQEGTLKFSDVTVDPSTGSFYFRMIFPNPKQILLPGMYVRAVLTEGVIEQAILAPQQGISRDPKGNPLALVVDTDGKVRQRMLTLDREIGNKWLVSSGLHPGDRVIVEGRQKVKPGDSVKVVLFEAGQPNGREAVNSSRQATTAH